jgi:hypothetical protein
MSTVVTVFKIGNGPIRCPYHYAMPEPVTRKDDDQDPAQLVAEIQRLTAEVWRRVQEWHDSLDWQDTDRNRQRYAVTEQAAASVDKHAHRARPDVGAVTEAAEPISRTWRPALAGPEQAIYAAVHRLRALLISNQE